MILLLIFIRNIYITSIFASISILLFESLSQIEATKIFANGKFISQPRNQLPLKLPNLIFIIFGYYIHKLVPIFRSSIIKLSDIWFHLIHLRYFTLLCPYNLINNIIKKRLFLLISIRVKILRFVK